MLKTILEIEIRREDFDKLFPDDLCVMRNDIREHEQYWGYSYTGREDKTIALYEIVNNLKNKYDFNQRHKLSCELEMYMDIVHGRGKTPFVVFKELL